MQKDKKKLHNYAFYDKKPIIGNTSYSFGVAGTIIGLFLRGLIIFTAVFGLSLLFSNSFGLGIKTHIIFLTALLSVLIFSLMAYVRPLFYGINIIGIIYIIIKIISTDKFGIKLFSALVMTINKMIDKLVDIGYYGLIEKKIKLSLSVDEGIESTIIIFIIIISAVLTFSCIKYTRPLFPAIITSLILVPIFMYNIVEGNFEITLVLCSLTAIIIMRIFDKKYLKKQGLDEYDSETVLSETLESEPRKYFSKLNIKKHIPHANTGITGFCAFVLSLIILIIPSIKTDKEFPTIKFIDDKIEICRQYITAYLMGRPDLLEELLYAINYNNFEPRDLNFLDRTFTGEKIFKVEAQSNIPIYLRSWVATEYRDGKWFTPEYESVTYKRYKAFFGRAEDPSSIMFGNFCKFIDSDILGSDLNYEDKGIYKEAYGFTIMQVNIEKLSNKVNDVVYIPTYKNPMYSIRKYGSPRVSDFSYADFFDGIYTGKSFDKGTKYGIVACVPSYSDTSKIESLLTYMVLYTSIINEVKPELDDYINRCMGLESVGLYDEDGNFINDSKLNKIKDDIYNILSDSRINVVEGQPVYVSFDDLVPYDEQEDFISSICQAYLYSDFVYKIYSNTAKSDIISDYYRDLVDSATETAEKITYIDGKLETVEVEQKADFSYAEERFSTKPQAYFNRHKLVTEIIDNITNEDVFQYNLLRTKKPDTSLDPIENFLTVTNEGYCMQFASAAVLLLREAGIPARYVEGYVALDFKENTDSDAAGSYVTTVRDEHAHAWIEVWYDGIGWVQYEATTISNSQFEGLGKETTNIEDTTTYIEDTTVKDTTTTDSTTTTSPDISEDTDTTTPPTTTTDDPNTSDITDTTTEIITETIDTSGDESDSDSTISISPTDEITDTTGVVIQGKMVYIGILFAISVVIISSTIAFVVISYKKSVIAQGERTALVSKINNGNYTADEQRKIALGISENVISLLRVYDTTPNTGEFSGEYAHRLGKTYPEIFKDNISAGEMIFHISAEEFGKCMDNGGISMLASVYTKLYESRKKHLNIFERMYYKLIKHFI